MPAGQGNHFLRPAGFFLRPASSAGPADPVTAGAGDSYVRLLR